MYFSEKYAFNFVDDHLKILVGVPVTEKKCISSKIS